MIRQCVYPHSKDLALASNNKPMALPATQRCTFGHKSRDTQDSPAGTLLKNGVTRLSVVAPGSSAAGFQQLPHLRHDTPSRFIGGSGCRPA